LQIVAQNWLIVSLTHSPFFPRARRIPAAAAIILFSLIGGVFADRYDRGERCWCRSASRWDSGTLAMLCISTPSDLQILALSFVTAARSPSAGPRISRSSRRSSTRKTCRTRGAQLDSVHARACSGPLAFA